MDIDLRKYAADIVGRAALEERCGTPTPSAVDVVLEEKRASAADPDLLAVAEQLGGRGALDLYEALGGRYALRNR